MVRINSSKDETLNTYFHPRSKNQFSQITGYTEIGDIIFTVSAYTHMYVCMHIVATGQKLNFFISIWAHKHPLVNLANTCLSVKLCGIGSVSDQLK